MRQLIIEYPHPRYPHYPQQKPVPSPVGEGWGEGSKPKTCLPVSENVQYLIAESIGSAHHSSVRKILREKARLLR